jgi:hypothetical protein
MPREVAQNTVIPPRTTGVRGAHGLVSSKVGTGYDEAVRVPLIVMDPPPV